MRARDADLIASPRKGGEPLERGDFVVGEAGRRDRSSTESRSSPSLRSRRRRAKRLIIAK